MVDNGGPGDVNDIYCPPGFEECYE
jgi:hypothetical protein